MSSSSLDIFSSILTIDKCKFSFSYSSCLTKISSLIILSFRVEFWVDNLFMLSLWSFSSVWRWEFSFESLLNYYSSALIFVSSPEIFCFNSFIIKFIFLRISSWLISPDFKRSSFYSAIFLNSFKLFSASLFKFLSMLRS